MCAAQGSCAFHEWLVSTGKQFVYLSNTGAKSSEAVRRKLRTARDYRYAKDLWKKTFAEHHYMDGDLHRAAVVDVLRLEETNEPVGFIATVSHYGQVDTKDKAAHEKSKVRREHRVVVLPAFQGLGLGPALSNESAALWTATPHGDPVKTEKPNWRYSSVTAHPRFGQYRESAPQRALAAAPPAGRRCPP